MLSSSVSSDSSGLSRQFSKLFLFCAVLLSLLLSACGSDSGSNTTTGASTSAKVQPPTSLVSSGKLTVGMDTTYTPMEYVDNTTNQYAGFDVELADAMAKHMGLQLSVQKTGFDTILDDLRNKRFDIVMSSITINDKRKEQFDFVPYFRAGESLLVQKGNPKKLKSVSDLCGLAVGVQTGTTEKDDLDTASADCKKNGKGEIQQTVLQSQTDVIQLLANKRVDATYQDSPVTDYYNKINPGQFEVGGSIVNSAPYGIAIRKGDTSTLNSLQKAFDAVKSDGTYNNLFAKWQFNPTQKI